MGCQSNSSSQNATPPAFAIADGAQELDPSAIASDLVDRFGPGGMDPRVKALIPGFDAPFFQAGLAGYSDAAMRIIARRHGCPICVTEALLDRTLLDGGKGFAKADLGEIHDNVPGGDEDHPLIGQIMGSDPAEMAAAAIKMIEQGKLRSNKEYRKLAESDEPRATSHLGLGEDADHATRVASGQSPVPSSFAAIDVNLACPVKKISKKSRGGHWLREPEGAIEILQAVRDAVPDSIPVTVKMRRSYDDTPEMKQNFLYLFDAAYDLGCAWVVVHGRTVEQKYVGPSRWDPLKELVDRNPERIIMGSGDVWDVNQIFRMIAYTGVSGVSVARGCIGNPWIFRQARDLLEGREPREPTIGEQRAVLEQHFELALAVNKNFRDPELHTAKNMRKFGIKFAAHHPQALEVKKSFIYVKSLDDWEEILKKYYGMQPI
ncbi:MAG: tRNA-dihydrouridine synthase [Phycisphaerae bacterium]|nr:tRNA-dihydrouridine synthase [Phycisphaerae bacterium]MBM89999.1 tRNA-dihydrouridine synthase [Phycisphaerae bacterium]HCT44652.1 tRNA-dihydrouridine synthase [Phycisphaerales bacterium]